MRVRKYRNKAQQHDAVPATLRAYEAEHLLSGFRDTSAMAVRYVVSKGCVYCGGCVAECPAGAVRMTSRGAVIDQDVCTGCGLCYDNCVAEAIEKLEQPAGVSGRENHD